MSKPPKNMLGNLIADVGASVAADVAKPVAEPVAPTPTVVEAPAAPVVVAAPAPREVVNIKPRKQATKPVGRGTIRDRAKQLSIYLEEPVYELIREIGHVERKKIHQLLLEGVDLMLKKKGYPSTSELLKKVG